MFSLTHSPNYYFHLLTPIFFVLLHDINMRRCLGSCLATTLSFFGRAFCFQNLIIYLSGLRLLVCISVLFFAFLPPFACLCSPLPTPRTGHSLLRPSDWWMHGWGTEQEGQEFFFYFFFFFLFVMEGGNLWYPTLLHCFASSSFSDAFSFFFSFVFMK